MNEFDLVFDEAESSGNRSGGQPYQLLPPLSEDEYESLKADIVERGVLVAVELDEFGNILDGHHRVRIAEELNIDYPVVVRSGMSELEKRSHARALNTLRRHLSREQKREIIVAELRENPSDSNNAIAKRLGVSDTTVGTIRDLLGDEVRVDYRVGADGKLYPFTNANKQRDIEDILSFLDIFGDDVAGADVDDGAGIGVDVEIKNEEQLFVHSFVFQFEQREMVFEAIRHAKKQFGVRTQADAIAKIAKDYLLFYNDLD